MYKETFGKINLNRKVKIKRYAPESFARICKLADVKEEQLLESLDPSKNIKQIQNAGLGAGASGSFFFFTNDHRFIMKTMSLAEVNQMIRILPAYLEHIETNSSFVARILGIYTIYMDKFTPLSVMIMENGLPNILHSELQYTFDLKGSSVNREVLHKKSMMDLRRDEPTGGKVLKDLDFLRLKDLKKFVNFDNEDWQKITTNLAKDSKFMQDMGFIDYSLLLSIRKIEGEDTNEVVS